MDATARFDYEPGGIFMSESQKALTPA